MNSHFLQWLQKFQEDYERLFQSSPRFFEVKSHQYFFQRWYELHKKSLLKIAEENFEALELENQEFIKKRARMVSAFVQNLKRTSDEKKFLSVFQELLKDFDEMYTVILQEVLKYFSAELVKAQRFRKVTAAYAHAYET